MQQIDGVRFGLWSLRIDAIYCAILGTAVSCFAEQISTVLSLPIPLILGAGITVTVWSVTVLWMILKCPIRYALYTVMGVNILAALLVGMSALAAAEALAIASILAISVDVALFAASQWFALRRIARHKTT